MLTLVTESFGVRGLLGDLVPEQKLVAIQFDQEDKSCLVVNFAERELEIVYTNHDRLEYGDYRIGSVYKDGKVIELTGSSVIIPRNSTTSIKTNRIQFIKVELCR